MENCSRASTRSPDRSVRMARTRRMSRSRATVQPASSRGFKRMGFLPPSDRPSSVSRSRPASSHSFTMVETVALFRPVRRQMSARLMGQCRSTTPMISHRLEARMSFVWVIFINARPFLLWVLPIPVRKYYTI